MRNLYGQPLQPCGEPHHTPGSWDAERKCSELGGGVHQICAVMHPDTAKDFSTETGQSDWSKDREGQNHCLCLGAYALYTAKGKDQGKQVQLQCASIREEALSPRYVGKWSTWNGHEKGQQIQDGVRDLVQQCLEQAPDESARHHLQRLACRLQGSQTLRQQEGLVDLGCPAVPPGQLAERYRHIFSEHHPHAQNNRNAAGHLWAAHILDHAPALTTEQLTTLFTEYCPVSGSPVQPGRTPFAYERQGDRLVATDAGTTAVSHCCRPCICDLQDGARVVDHPVVTQDGEQRLPLLVLQQNPCQDQPDGSLAHSNAPAMHCTDGQLTGAKLATLEDGRQLPIIGLVQEGVSKTTAHQRSAVDYCNHRKDTGYQGGMGGIFRKAAGLESGGKLEH